MSYVFDGITVEGYRPASSPAAGTAAGAVSALLMAAAWCGISHFTRGDASLPLRAIAATILGHPGDDDPPRRAIAIALGLLIHLAIGMMLGHALERAVESLPAGKAPRGALILVTVALAFGLSAGALDKLAPAFASAVPSAAFVAGHLLLGIALELTGFFRGEARAPRSAT